MYYEMNNNKPTLVQGVLTYQSSGILTYDGVHTPELGMGNILLADQISEGIYQALVPEPSSLSLLVMGFLALLCRQR